MVIAYDPAARITWHERHGIFKPAVIVNQFQLFLAIEDETIWTTPHDTYQYVSCLMVSQQFMAFMQYPSHYQAVALAVHGTVVMFTMQSSLQMSWPCISPTADTCAETASTGDQDHAIIYAFVAQPYRASRFERGGWGLESLRGLHRQMPR